MDDMRELVSVEVVERVFLALAIAGPVVGTLTGAVLGVRRRTVSRSWLRGLAVGMLGPVNWVLWRMYGALTDHFGLDSVKGLLLNMAIFVGLGLAAGLGYGYTNRERASTVPEPGGDIGGRDGKEDTRR